MFPASNRQGVRERETTPFDRCLRLLSRVIGGPSDENAGRVIDEYVSTLHDDARGAALDEMVRRRLTEHVTHDVVAWVQGKQF
jgi:hypothetical protein